MNARASFVQASIAQAWDRASRRERRFAIAGLVVVALGLAWTLIWRPLQADVERTRSERARLSTLLAVARASVDEAAGATQSGAKPSTADWRAAVTRAFAERGVQFGPGTPDLRDDRVRVVLPEVRFDTLVIALHALAHDDGLRPTEATLTARVEPGVLRAEITFAR